VADIAGDLAAKGFDEVQLDYIRFYSDGPYELAETNLPHTQSFRLPTIQRVMRVISDRLAWTQTFLSADVFPIAFIATDDQGIGQRPEVIMPYVDYFSPMVYPPLRPQISAIRAERRPYDVIDKTLERMNVEKVGLPVVIRPWIQDSVTARSRTPPTRSSPKSRPSQTTRQGLDDLERPVDFTEAPSARHASEIPPGHRRRRPRASASAAPPPSPSSSPRPMRPVAAVARARSRGTPAR
jgi:hypothetical protein